MFYIVEHIRTIGYNKLYDYTYKKRALMRS